MSILWAGICGPSGKAGAMGPLYAAILLAFAATTVNLLLVADRSLDGIKKAEEELSTTRSEVGSLQDSD
eukprot:2481054-Amphidinium_carterae.1